MLLSPVRISLKKSRNLSENLEIMVGIIIILIKITMLNAIMLGLTPEEKAEVERKAQEELVG